MNEADKTFIAALEKLHKQPHWIVKQNPITNKFTVEYVGTVNEYCYRRNKMAQKSTVSFNVYLAPKEYEQTVKEGDVLSDEILRLLF